MDQGVIVVEGKQPAVLRAVLRYIDCENFLEWDQLGTREEQEQLA
jgi:hypothetical protein